MRYAYAGLFVACLAACSSSSPPDPETAHAPAPTAAASETAPAPSATTTATTAPEPVPEMSGQEKLEADMRADAEKKNLVVDEDPTSKGANKVPLYGAIATAGTTWKVKITEQSKDGAPKTSTDRCKVEKVSDAGWAIIAKVSCTGYKPPPMFAPDHPLEGYWMATAKGLFRTDPMDDPAANQPPLAQRFLVSRAAPAAMNIEGVFIDSAAESYRIAEKNGAWCRVHEQQQGSRFSYSTVCMADGKGFTRAELVWGLSEPGVDSKTTITYELSQ